MTFWSLGMQGIFARCIIIMAIPCILAITLIFISQTQRSAGLKIWNNKSGCLRFSGLALGLARPLNQLGAGKGRQETPAAGPTGSVGWSFLGSGSWSARLGPEASRLAPCALSGNGQGSLNHPTPEKWIHKQGSSELLPLRNNILQPGRKSACRAIMTCVP